MKYENTIATAVGCSLVAFVIGFLLGFRWGLNLTQWQSTPSVTIQTNAAGELVDPFDGGFCETFATDTICPIQ
jgi:hypothetical protein